MHQCWTTETVLAALREAGAEHGYWTQVQWAKAQRTPTTTTVKRVFGSWVAAWNAAGYRLVRQRLKPPMRNWTRQTVLDTLTRIGQEQGRWLTIKEWDAQKLQPHSATIWYYFGSWRGAWNAAGVTLPPQWQDRRFVPRGTWTRELILNTLRQHARSDGTIMNVGDWSRSKLQPTHSTIYKFCGSYAQAIQSLGLVIVSNYRWRQRTVQTEWQRAFQTLTKQLGHRPSRREWDAWPERPVDTIYSLVLPFERTRSRLYDTLRTVNLDLVDDPTDRAWILRYIAGDTLETIGRDAGVTRERIRQRLNRAVRRARQTERATAAAAALLSNGAVTDSWMRTVLEMVAAGSPVTEIAHATQWAPRTIRAFLQALGDHSGVVPQQAVDDLPLLSPRTIHALKRGHIMTVQDLMTASDDDLMSLWGFGVRCAKEVQYQRTVLTRGESIDGQAVTSTSPLAQDSIAIAHMDTLPTRVHNCLRRAHIDTIGDLRQRSDADLLRLPNFGVGCLRAVHGLLNHLDTLKVPAEEISHANNDTSQYHSPHDVLPISSCIDRLSTRTRNCLRRAHIDTIGDLRRRSDTDLLRLPNFGVWCLREVHQMLARLETLESSDASLDGTGIDAVDDDSLRRHALASP